MNVERWQQVRELLERALSLSPSDRSPYLEKACTGDSDLRDEIETILRSYEKAGGSEFMKSPAVDLLDRVEGHGPASRVGRRVGVYQILDEIGHGGMGEVYRARRVDGQYENEVAVKLVRSGYDTSFVLERFRDERQILATLSHPNIARLLDGGTTEDGVPYLVMELIDGAPIDQFCAGRKLSISDRLQLFRQVCSAVEYAHQHLVIHRDIKPGNILVTADGIPKLLDFGIAKILDSPAGGKTTLLHPLTPDYASPEQLRGEPITTATDVYSLGVVLYQLLTGRLPYQLDNRTPTEYARAIAEMEPKRPSTAVARPDQPQAMHEGSSAKLRRRLRGDLDTIALKALRKEPPARYSSVEQLSEDLRRELDGLPVAARKGSWSYRAGKFLRRHRISMTAAALVGLAIVGGVVATLREARIAAANAKRAEQRFNDIRKLADSLIFEIHDSIQSLPGATPSRKLLLDRAVEYLDKLSQDAAGDVDLQRQLAWGYQRLSAVQGDTSQSNLGQISAAETSVRKSITLFEAVAKANPHHLTDQLNLAMAYRRRAFTDVYERVGRKEIDQALAITEPLMQSDGAKAEVRSERSLEFQILALIQDATGDRMQAVDTFRKYLDLRKDILRTNPEFKGIRQGVTHASVELAFQLGRFQDRNEALQLMNQALAQYDALLEEGATPDLIRDRAASQVRRGLVELINGDPSADIADSRQARAATARLARLDSSDTMVQADMCGFDFEEGRALIVMGKPGEGLRLVQGSQRCFRDLHMEADVGPGTGALESWIAEGESREHHLAEALKHYQNGAAALTEDLEKYDDARCDLAMVETKIGRMLLDMGKMQAASEQYNKALETAKLPYSIEHMDIPAIYAAADAYAGLGDIASAEARRTPDRAARSALLAQAHKSYEDSLKAWKQVPAPSKVSANGYLAASGTKEVSARLASLPQ
jgi:eukaryotic-like serine/threonine-protein kinase